jgi:hypothetical protein
LTDDTLVTSKKDQIIERWVEEDGTNDWETIATFIPGGTPRQCQERWCTYLSPDVNRKPWSASEDERLFDHLQTHGPKWGSIVGLFSNRTQDNIKNRWNTVVRKARVLELDPANRICFTETGQKIAFRSTQTTFDRPKPAIPVSPQQLYSLGNLPNSKVPSASGDDWARFCASIL